MRRQVSAPVSVGALVRMSPAQRDEVFRSSPAGDIPRGTGDGVAMLPLGPLPTRQQLDTILPNRPAQLLSYDGHAAWVNTRALKLAGITRKTPNPPNGIIVKDPRTGEPTGVLKEAAIGLVTRHLPATLRADRMAALRSVIEEAHRNGVTSLQNSTGNAEDLELYAEARRDGELLVQTEWLGIDATVRTWLSRAEGYIPPVEIGEVVRCSGVGRVSE